MQGESQLLTSSQLKSKVLDHGSNDAFEFLNINRIPIESSLSRNRLSLRIWNDRRMINSLGFFPNHDTIFPNTLSIISIGISCTARINLMPRLQKVWKVLSPTMGIFLMDRGARKDFSAPASIFLSLFGFASPVAILEMVLLTEKQKK